MLTTGLLSTPLLDERGLLALAWAIFFRTLTPANVQGARLTTGAVAAGVRADVVVNWPISFIDTLYSATASVEDDSAAGLGLRVERIRAKSAKSITVQVVNDSAGPLTGVVNVLGIHD